MKSANNFATLLNAHASSDHEGSLNVTSSIIFNPFMIIESEDFSDASLEQRQIYLKNKCKEAETVIITLSRMFDGEIIAMDIPELNLQVPCILKTSKKLSSRECGHIRAISPHLQII